MSKAKGLPIEEVVVRPVRGDDAPAVLELAKTSGGGMTSLPADLDALRARCERAAACFVEGAPETGEEIYLLVAEHAPSKTVVGTGGVIAHVGMETGFVTYRENRVVQTSDLIDRRIETRTFALSYDYTGLAEFLGLYVHRSHRGCGLGRLMLRATLMFVATHRERFPDRIVAEMRGWCDSAGRRPFWDAVCRRSFGMSYDEADTINAIHGNTFIAELMPRDPICIDLLPQEAQDVIGRPHPEGEPAYHLLTGEGFLPDGHHDCFDGGPCLSSGVDKLASIMLSGRGTLSAPGAHKDATPHIVAMGQGDGYRALVARGVEDGAGFVAAPNAMSLLGAAAGAAAIWRPHGANEPRTGG